MIGLLGEAESLKETRGCSHVFKSRVIEATRQYRKERRCRNQEKVRLSGSVDT